MNAAPGYTVDELAARAGVTVRTVRFYSTKGLLPPPELGPRRVGRYGAEHLARLALIEELQHQGLTLAAIERYLEQLPEGISAHDLALHRALVASWVPEAAREATREELERRAGRSLTDADVERLEAMDVLRRTDDPDVFEVDPGLLHLGVRLVDLPVPQESLSAARRVMLEHARDAAREISRLFREEVWRPEQVREMRSLSAHMQPLVVQALVTAFQRTLKDEFRALFSAADTAAAETASTAAADADADADEAVSSPCPNGSAGAGARDASPRAAAPGRRP
jgi:DNA-binding transcriptional MerR regulator